MPRTVSRGRCLWCNGEFSKTTITRHLENCPRRPTTLESAGRQKVHPARLFHLRVEGRYAPMYWMNVEVPADATLLDLDSFLRGQWLECCGHLSAFTIAGARYASPVDRSFGLGERSMRAVTLDRVLYLGQQFEHEYDFGSTTTVKLKVLGEREGLAVGKEVRLLAQNLPPHIPCSICGQEATQVCTQCIDEDAGWLCDDCMEEHDCGEEMMLPVVNSPRVGVCGYEG